MKDIPHAILFNAVLSYLATVTDEGDVRISRAMGLRDDQVNSLRSMSARTVMKMAMKCTGCVHVEVDAEAFDDLLNAVSHEVQDECLREAYIKQDASREMMEKMFGMTPRDYAVARQFLGVPLSTGRTRDVTDDEAEAIYDALQGKGEQCEPVELLEIAQNLDLPLRVVWEELNRNYQHSGARRQIEAA